MLLTGSKPNSKGPWLNFCELKSFQVSPSLSEEVRIDVGPKHGAVYRFIPSPVMALYPPPGPMLTQVAPLSTLRMFLSPDVA